MNIAEAAHIDVHEQAATPQAVMAMMPETGSTVQEIGEVDQELEAAQNEM